LECWVPGTQPGTFEKLADLEATPIEKLRCRRLVSVAASKLEAQAKAGTAQIRVRLSVGGAEVETLTLRVLHAEEPWPGTLLAGPDCLFFKADGSAGSLAQRAGRGATDPAPEKVIMLVPKESESEYRKFAPIKRLERRALGKEALFLGDPLVEGVTPKPNVGELFGVAQSLAAMLPEVSWKGICVPGPHRYLPVFRMIADLESYERACSLSGKLPALAVLCLGGGDAARQTPLYTFERALDVLITRLRRAGVQRIVAISEIPEPEREKQCEPYHNRVAEVMQQHHVECVDVFNAWLRDRDWESYYTIRLDGPSSPPVYGAVPNAQAREAIAKLIRNQL
jgi:hypothetical protein